MFVRTICDICCFIDTKLNAIKFKYNEIQNPELTSQVKSMHSENT